MRRRDFWLRIAAALALLFIFLCGVNGLGSGFKMLGKDLVKEFFAATSNPFVGLTVGILATTLVQSSSVSTSMIVGMVAAQSLTVGQAVPMIMGANIGTTVTNTIVSMGHITRKEEFRRAFAAATCHDFFNFIAVAILLPLELATGALETGARWLATTLAGTSGGEFPNPLKDATKAAFAPVIDGLSAIAPSDKWAAVFVIFIAAAIIFLGLFGIVKTLRAVASDKVETLVARSLGKSVVLGIIVGVIVTFMVQSSSITTSILVPLAGAGLIRLEEAFPITVGANIGTTLTAMIASLALPGAELHLGLTIALVHLLFNLAGVVIVFGIPGMRKVPLKMARWLSDIAVTSRRYALLYVLALFYGLPAALVIASRVL